MRRAEIVRCSKWLAFFPIHRLSLGLGRSMGCLEIGEAKLRIIEHEGGDIKHASIWRQERGTATGTSQMRQVGVA